MLAETVYGMLQREGATVFVSTYSAIRFAGVVERRSQRYRAWCQNNQLRDVCRQRRTSPSQPTPEDEPRDSPAAGRPLDIRFSSLVFSLSTTIDADDGRRGQTPSELQSLA